MISTPSSEQGIWGRESSTGVVLTSEEERPKTKRSRQSWRLSIVMESKREASGQRPLQFALGVHLTPCPN